MTIERSTFFDCMASFASGVTVVTSAHNNRLIGLTVSAFASLSADPMLVLVCINKNVQSHDALVESGRFAVNVLSESQADLSANFASKQEDKFQEIAYTLSDHGVPVLDGTLSHVECQIVNLLPGGDHTIIVGEVISGSVRSGRPLLYFERQYHEVA